jgi:hypothetical protein
MLTCIYFLLFSKTFHNKILQCNYFSFVCFIIGRNLGRVRYVQNNYHNTSSVTSMIDTLGWPTLAERRLKTRLIMLFKITHALIAIPNIILIPTDSRTRKSHNQTFRHITTQKDTYKW